MAKMSKIAKDIKNQPKLKKALATYIAENTRIPDTLTLLLEGHRGFLAMTEKELSKLFDEKYEAMHRRMAEVESKMLDAHDAYSGRMYENEIKNLNSKIKEADELYDSLFEHLFL